MATNNFNSDPTNDSFEPLMSYFDSQGVNRLESANISSYGFDGFIPTVIQNRTASGILPGMAISLTGSSTGQNFYKVLSNNVGDREFTASPSNEIVIEYLDNDQLVQVLSASVNDIFSVSYENWDGKDLGTTGWYLGNSGNAIFSNVAVRGRIEATSGKVEELIIGSNYYPIIDIVGVNIQSSSVTGNKGQFIMNTNTNGKRLYPQDIVQVSGISASGWTYTQGSPSTASTLFTYLNKIKVLTASYSGGAYKYHCELVQSGVLIDYNLGSMTAKSGSFTFGDMFFGDYQTYSLSAPDIIEGFVFDQIGQGGTWDSYTPDFIDISGRFRLGGGKITFDSSTLNVTGNIYALGGEISGTLAIVDGGEIYVGNNQNSGQRINIRHTDLTGYSELGYPTFSLVTGSAVNTSPLLQSGGFDDLTPGQDADPPWQSFWGFGGIGGGSMTAIVDSIFYKDGGKSLRVSTASYEGGVSAVSQDVNLIPGEEYIVSAWVYSSRNLQIASGNYLDIWLLSSSFSGPTYFTSGVAINSLVGATEVTAGIWTKLSNKFVAPPSPTQYYSLHMREWLPASASVWWDTIELTKAKTVSTISGLYFNDGELFSDTLSIRSDGSAIFGRINTASAVGTNPDATNITGILSISGANPTYRLWSGHLDPTKAGFRLDTNGHITTGLITSSATYNRTDTTAYVSISAAGVLGRYSSTQRIKYDILPINTLLGPSIDQSKIVSSSPSINYRNILSVTPVEYSLIDQPEGRKFGFIAEDVADKLPEIATYDDEGPTYFDMAGLIAATLAVIQDQQKNIDDLTNRVLQLESQLGG
jgi:hypothetical protein